MMPRILLILLSLVLANAYASGFEESHVVWEHPEIQIAFTDSVHEWFKPDDFCLALAIAEPDLGRPKCRIAGEWERDSAAQVYLQWLGLNVNPRVKSIDLASRNPQVIQRIHRLDDQYLVVLVNRRDTLWQLLFTGSRTLAEGAPLAGPAAMSWQASPVLDAKKLGTDLATRWFSSSSIPRLSDQEKNAQAAAPDQAFSETPPFDTWIALGGGWSQARIPLTPYSWYRGRFHDQIRNYHDVHDSLSAWSFLDNESPIATLRAGFCWSGFLGLELFGTYSKYNAKYDPTDSVYQDLDHWFFRRFEVGATAHVWTNHPLPHRFDWQSSVFLGFHYSFLKENIALVDGAIPSRDYLHRVSFLNSYKGAIFGVSSRLLWNKLIAIEARTGISNRGKSLDQEPSADAVREPTIIGGSTLDCFISTSLEVHLPQGQTSGAKASR